MFGRFEAAFYRAYDAAYPRDPGHERRQDLYNLYHVLNHYNLFGGHGGHDGPTAAAVVARLAESLP